MMSGMALRSAAAEGKLFNVSGRYASQPYRPTFLSIETTLPTGADLETDRARWSGFDTEDAVCGRAS
jgi:hypothetical protein